MKSASVPKIHGLKILTTNSLKTAKGFNKGDLKPILTAILYLYPNALLCPHAKACRAHCLVHAGQGGMSETVRDCRIRRTLLFQHDRAWFIDALKKDIVLFEAYCKKHGYTPAVRLNGTSDLLWERMIDLDQFESVFYDYTKIPVRHRHTVHVTFSYDAINIVECQNAILAGKNVAVCFKDRLPESFLGLPVYSGDLDDMRFLDDHAGAICGLVYKRDTRKKHLRTPADNGFIVDMDRNPTLDLLSATREDIARYNAEMTKAYTEYKGITGWNK